MDVSSIRPSQQLYSAFVLDLDVCGGAVVYVNGVEVLRHQLPLGVLTKDTVPLESFPRTERVSAALSMQFNVWEKDVVVVAVEIHDASLQPRSEFRLGVRLLPDGSQRHIGGSLSVNKPKGMVEDLNHLTDGLYYNKMVVHGSCDDIQVTIDSHQHAYEYVTEICLYAGNSAASIHTRSFSTEERVAQTSRGRRCIRRTCFSVAWRTDSTRATTCSTTTRSASSAFTLTTASTSRSWR